jgi:hypothetical protein
VWTLIAVIGYYTYTIQAMPLFKESARFEPRPPPPTPSCQAAQDVSHSRNDSAPTIIPFNGLAYTNSMPRLPLK